MKSKKTIAIILLCTIVLTVYYSRQSKKNIRLKLHQSVQSAIKILGTPKYEYKKNQSIVAYYWVVSIPEIFLETSFPFIKIQEIDRSFYCEFTDNKISLVDTRTYRNFEENLTFETFKEFFQFRQRKIENRKKKTEQEDQL
jgi:hypothetical protein